MLCHRSRTVLAIHDSGFPERARSCYLRAKRRVHMHQNLLNNVIFAMTLYLLPPASA